MRIEVIITVWDDHGDFKSRDRIESANTDSIREEFDIAVGIIENRIIEQEQNKYKTADDDDIPF